MSNAAPSPFACPADHALLEAGADSLTCRECTAVYPLTDGVVRFTEDDPFYEGAYQNTVRWVPRSERPWHVMPLWLINSGYLWHVRRAIPSGATVVELGCAAGVAYFGPRYRMIGLDVSFAAVRSARSSYAHVAQVDARADLPLGDASVDAVLSSYFFEHIVREDKRRLLAECARILRPGGKVVFLYDVASENPLLRALRDSAPERFDRLFLAQDGHVGYHDMATNRSVFEEAGLTVTRHFGMERTPVQSPSVYSKCAEWPGPMGLLGRLGARLGHRPLFLPYTAALRAVDETIGRAAPPSWSRIAMTIAEKPAW